jgi:hypothetical protein
LNGDRSIAVTFMAFDLLELDGRSLLRSPLDARRSLLESLALNSSYWMTPETFADGPELYAAVCKHGLEGIVAKRASGTYRPGYRGWLKVKNPYYWRREGDEGYAAAARASRRVVALRQAGCHSREGLPPLSGLLRWIGDIRGAWR